VAIKVLPKNPDETKPTRLKLYEKEITVLHTVDHPHIASYYETYDDKDNLYLVMELVDGLMLSDIAKR